MSSVSKRGGRQELSDVEHGKLVNDLKNGNRAARRRAVKLLRADNNRIDKLIDDQNRRLGTLPTQQNGPNVSV